MGWGRKRNHQDRNSTRQEKQPRKKKPTNSNSSNSSANSSSTGTGGERVVDFSNALFESYYRGGGASPNDVVVVPADEWDAFLACLRTPLPVCFRITGIRAEAVELRAMLHSRFFPALAQVLLENGTERLQPPEALSWYPEGLAFMYTMGRREMRKSPQVQKFWQFLVQETELGTISRQEAVSMIPPLMLDVRPEHRVLDMCAAPGSKTTQLIEAIHEGMGDTIPEGFVVANDTDLRRCHLLAHQTQRLHSPCVLVTNYDAGTFPSFVVNNQSLKFDRILCDVPCSGDGTLRKNITIWRDWKPQNAIGLHRTQLKILVRGCQLLKVGGRLVYSTCSLNPLEDEAVIAQLFKKLPGSMELVDAKDLLPTLKRRQGLHMWRVMVRDGNMYGSYSELPPEHRKIEKSLFCPGEDFCKSIHLERCMRILPHDQNTGGFFVAVLQKVAPVNRADRHLVGLIRDPTASAEAQEPPQQQQEDGVAEEENEKEEDEAKEAVAESSPSTASASASSASASSASDQAAGTATAKEEDDDKFTEDPFILVDTTSNAIQNIRNFFRMDDFPFENLLVRSANYKRLYYVSKNLATILKHVSAGESSHQKLRLVNAGVRVFIRNEAHNDQCLYRLQQESVDVVRPHIKSQLISVGADDLLTLLKKDTVNLAELSPEFQARFDQSARGSCALLYDPPSDSGHIQHVFVGWSGKSSLALQVSKRARASFLLRLFDQDSGSNISNSESLTTEASNDHDDQDASADNELE